MARSFELFVSQVPDFGDKKTSEVIDYVVYFLTVIEGHESVTAAQIDQCFDDANLTKYSNTSAYLTRGAKRVRGKTPKFIRKSKGIRFERSFEVGIQKNLNTAPARIETSELLRSLLPKVTSAQEQNFLREAIDCYEIGARRAAVVMTWLLAVNHLYEHVLNHKLSEFNAVLAANTDKRIKITAVSTIDDFSEIPEGKLMEFLRSSKVISNDVRKILETKLGIRNSTAHPSAVTLSEVKVTDFIIDLIDNVVLKYKK